MYAYAYNEGRIERLKTSKDGLYHFLLVVLPRISPWLIKEQVLGHWTI